MRKTSWMGYYIGREFPEYYGREIEIDEDISDIKNPCYRILFVGEHYWHDNMGDQDWQLTDPKCKHEGDEDITYGNWQYFKKCADCGAEI